MGNKHFSWQGDPATTAKALGRRLQLKHKFANEVARFVKGKNVDDAIAYLEQVEEKKAAIPVKRHVHGAGHRKGMGPGRFPVKAAKQVRKLLEQARANAEHKGLDPEKLVVVHASAYSAGVIPGYMPRARGRGTAWNTRLTHIEIGVEERGEA